MDKITKEILELFVRWTKLKVRIHISDRLVYPKQREIWWVSLGKNIGTEMDGKNDTFERPVIVIKKFNDQSLLIAPISTRVKNLPFLIKFLNYKNEINIINLTQIRSISQKRFLRKLGKLNKEDFEKMKDVIRKFI